MKNFRLNFLGADLRGLKTITFCLLALNVLSLVSIYSSLHQAGQFSDPQKILSKQIVWIIFSWLAIIIFTRINYRIYFDLAYLIYGLNLVLLIAVFFFGKKVMGAQRWIEIFGMNFQPSELSKISAIIILARFFSLSSPRGMVYGFLLPLIFIAINSLVIYPAGFRHGFNHCFSFFQLGFIFTYP